LTAGAGAPCRGRGRGLEEQASQSKLPGRTAGRCQGVENKFSSDSKHLDEDLAKLFDEILLQVFPRNLDDVSKDARTAGRLMTGRDVNETHLHYMGFNDSEFASSSHQVQQEEHLAKLFDEILMQVFSSDPKYLSREGASTADELLRRKHSNESKYLYLDLKFRDHLAEENKESSLFNRDVNRQLTTTDNGIQQRNTQGAYTSSLPCGQLLSFLQKNIIVATVAMASILLATVFTALVVLTCMRQKQPRYPPASTTYNIFIMSGKDWWQKAQEKRFRKLSGKQKHLNSGNSFV
ncbi:uncharacterized protein C2orf92 homolog, partial [Meriones unguiculatus]|uniref:uncharacterized protein C2orf92 homolog n=1 Tax=Meriones unguiculatus TaxID=10047 RepID=UPI00293F3B40